MLLIYLVLIYLALYIVIWLHEAGHGLVLYRYKCKENPFQVHVPFSIFFSTPAPYNLEKEDILSKTQQYHIGMAGIAVNLLFGVPLAVYLLLADRGFSSLSFFLFAFTIFHLLEAASYLVINNIFLSGDMVSVQKYKPWLRIPYFGIGLLTLYITVLLVINSPEEWRPLFVIASVSMIICTAVGRVIFNIMNKRKLVK